MMYDGYIPPIQAYYAAQKKELEGAVIRAVESVDIHVDPEELLKALQYDRGQYQKGYDAGFSAGFCETLQTVRCMECRYYDPDCGGRCKHPSGLPRPNWNDFCSHSAKGEAPTAAPACSDR